MKGSCRLEDGCSILLLKGMTSTQVCKPVNPLALWEGCAAWSGRVPVSISSTRTSNSVQVPCSAGQKLECAPLYIDGRCLNLKIINRNWSFEVPKNAATQATPFFTNFDSWTRLIKTPSEAWFHPAWAAFDHRRLRASLGVSRLWCWEGWGTWWDVKSSRIYIYIIYVAILFKHVDGSPVLYSRRMWISECLSWFEFTNLIQLVAKWDTKFLQIRLSIVA